MNFKEMRTLGRTGLQASRLGLAGGYGVPAASVERSFHEFGINYFYWSTPRKPGMREGLRSLAKDSRDKIIVVLQSYDHLGLTVKRSVEKGLKALNFDFADVVLLGWQNKFPSQRVIDEALGLKKSGLVRFIAMSGHNRKTFGKIARMTVSPIDIFMVRYNAAHRGAEEEVFPHLADGSARPGITTYTATRWGRLLNPKKMPHGERPLTASDCYRFVLSNPKVDVCMMGPANAGEFEEGIIALGKGPLSSEEMERVRKIGSHVHG